MTKSMSRIERFTAKYHVSESGCWEWDAAKNDGYGAFCWDRDGKGARTGRAHRFSYEYHVGPIPDGLQIDHLCRNRSCVNPAHLEPVTQLENIRRSPSPIMHVELRQPGYNSPKVPKPRPSHCRNGHELSGENLRLIPGERNCRTCARESARRTHAKRRAAARQQ